MTDVDALRAHLVAEVERAKREAVRCQSNAQFWPTRRYPCRLPHEQRQTCRLATTARTATDTWLAADTRLRTLDALIASAVAVRP